MLRLHQHLQTHAGTWLAKGRQGPNRSLRVLMNCKRFHALDCVPGTPVSDGNSIGDLADTIFVIFFLH